MATTDREGDRDAATREYICAYYDAQVASWIAQLHQIRALPEAVAYQPSNRPVGIGAARSS
jgi:hypothetical protein